MKLKLILIIAGILIILVLFLIYVISNKTQDLSNKEPHLYFLNADFPTTKEIILINNDNLPHLKEDFPKEISNEQRTDTLRVTHIKIPIGSTLHFTKAIHHKNAVSGVKRAILLGTVKNNLSNETYKVVYSYGEYKTTSATETSYYWEYEKGFW